MGSRGRWLEVATLLGVMAPFLPVFILVWLWRHRRSNDPTKPTWPVATRLLTVAAMVSTAVGTVGMQELRTLAFLTSAALYGAWLIAGICASYIVAIAMRLWGVRQRVPGTSTTPR